MWSKINRTGLARIYSRDKAWGSTRLGQYQVALNESIDFCPVVTLAVVWFQHVGQRHRSRWTQRTNTDWDAHRLFRFAVLLPARKLFYFFFFLFFSLINACRGSPEVKNKGGERPGRLEASCTLRSEFCRHIEHVKVEILELAAVGCACFASSTWCAALTLGNASVGLGDLTTDSGCQLLKR